MRWHAGFNTVGSIGGNIALVGIKHEGVSPAHAPTRSWRWHPVVSAGGFNSWPLFWRRAGRCGALPGVRAAAQL